MSPQHIGIAAPQQTAIPAVAEDTTASPYLDYVRPTRKIIKELMSAREIEVAKTTAATRRQRIERDLRFLRDELARLDGPNRAAVSAAR